MTEPLLRLARSAAGYETSAFVVHRPGPSGPRTAALREEGAVAIPVTNLAEVS